MKDRIIKITNYVFPGKPHKVSKFVPVVRLLQLKRKVEKYHKKIFDNFSKDKHHWSDEHEKCLVKMLGIKDDVKLAREDEVSRHILHLVSEAEQYRNIMRQKKKIQKLRDHIVVGLEQDVLFDRFHEYFSQVKKIVQNIENNQELRKCEEIFSYSQVFLNGCINDIEEQRRRSKEDLITMRIEHSEDLAYVCRRSDPRDEYEREKKINALTEVLNKYLLPLHEEPITDEQRVFLDKVIALYNQTIDSLN